MVIALTWDPLAIWVALMVMVYMWGHVSGAHYNPAVTVWVWMRWSIRAKDALLYVLVQVFWALVAVVLAAFLGDGAAFVPALWEGASMGQAILAEIVFTFALVSVVLNTATVASTKGNSYFGLAIWLTVFVAATAVGGISGWAFNPAVGLGPWLYDLFQWEWFSYVWLYIVGPLVWWVLAAWAFTVLNSPAE